MFHAGKRALRVCAPPRICSHMYPSTSAHSILDRRNPQGHLDKLEPKIKSRLQNALAADVTIDEASCKLCQRVYACGPVDNHLFLRFCQSTQRSRSPSPPGAAPPPPPTLYFPHTLMIRNPSFKQKIQRKQRSSSMN